MASPSASPIIDQARRSELLQILASMGIELPPQSKLPDEDLEKRLKQALNAAQRLSSTVPDPPLNPASLTKWPTESADAHLLVNAMRRHNLEEAVTGVSGMNTGEGPRFNALDPFLDLRQTLLSLALGWSKGVECFIIQDFKKEEWTLHIRILSVHKINDRTPVLPLIYRYYTKDNKPGSQWVDTLRGRGYSSTQNSTVTELERQLLLKLLALNSKLLSAEFQPFKDKTERDFKISCLLPIGPLSFEDLGSLNKRIGCTICGKTVNNRCASCQTVAYCGKECQRADWPDHKADCHNIRDGEWVTVTFVKTPPDTEGMYMLNFNKFDDPTAESSNNDIVRASNSDPPPNMHGNRIFLVKVQVARNSNSMLPTMIYDRQRSFQVFAMENSQPAVCAQLRAEAAGPRGGYNGLKIYRWARRVGDWKLSICVDRPPRQEVKW